VAELFESGPLVDDGGNPVVDNNLTNQTPPANLDEETAALLSIILALKGIDDNLQKAYEEYMKPTRNMAKVIAFAKASKLYQDYNRTARARAIASKEQPGVWKQEKEKYLTEQKKRIIASLGPKAWTPEVEKQVGIAFDFALDDDVLDKMIISTRTIGQIGGATIGTIDSLKQFADNYGVSNMYDDAFWNSKKDELFLGSTTIDDIQAEIKDMARQTYPGFASGFNLGQSLTAQTGYIRNTVAKVIGADPTSLKYDDPILSTWYQWKDPKTGEFTRPPQYLVEQGTKEKYFDAYARTPSGTAYLDGLTVKMLSDMGLM